MEGRIGGVGKERGWENRCDHKESLKNQELKARVNASQQLIPLPSEEEKRGSPLGFHIVGIL